MDEPNELHAELPGRSDVVVIGGGLAGLTAGAVAARAGARTVVLDAHAGGGRGAVQRVPLEGRSGEAVFNGGPRALYLGGAGRTVLGRLGIRPIGSKAPSKGSAALIDGRLDVLPAGAGSLVRSGVVPAAAKPRLLAALGAILTGRVRPGRPDQSASEWIADLAHGRDDVSTMLAALFRVATYTADLDVLSADAAVPQVCQAVGKGVIYQDGGFQQYVDALVAVGVAAAMELRSHAPVRSLEQRADGTWSVGVAGDRTVTAGAVVIAAGGPAVASGLLDLADLGASLGPAVTAACLELAVDGAVPQRFVLGIDEPLYLSEHCPPADLAPEGVRVVHVARYGATAASEDRPRLEALAAQVGIADTDVVARRFLGRMVVQTAMPSARLGGMAGRPAVAVGDRPGVFLAGDWVGTVGLLADASFASGESAGALAAAHAASMARTATVASEAP